MATNPHLFKYLVSGATKNAVGDYSASAVDFELIPASDEVYVLYRIMITVVDVGSFDSGAYGNNITLTNGISVSIANGIEETSIDLVDGLPIKTNADWSRLAGVDVKVLDFGLGDNQLIVRWTFERAGAPITLVGDQEESLKVTLNDDFTGLVSQYFLVQGLLVDRERWA